MNLRKWKHLPKVVQEEIKGLYLENLSKDTQIEHLLDKIETLVCPYPLHKMERTSGEKTRCTICELKDYAEKAKELQTSTAQS